MSNASSMKQPAGPWRVVLDFHDEVMVRDAESNTVAYVAEYGNQSDRPKGQAENAAFIVQACNSHDLLVEAAQAAAAVFARQRWSDTSTDPEAKALHLLRAALAAVEAKP